MQPDISTAGAWHGRARCLYWISALLIAGGYMLVHQSASFYCPAPWPDEGQFLWPTISFQRSNTLFSPHLNPDMTIMWMPPGYMVWHGTLFKLTGFSFPLVRWLSAVYILGAVCFVLLTAMRYGLRWIALILSGVFLLSKWFIFSGNIARMEAPILLMVSAAFLLLQTKQHYKALILLSLSPLVHPNAFYFCMGGGLYFLFRAFQHPDERKCSLADRLLMLVPVLLWSGYLVYIGFHWDEFRAHMPLQFVWKQQMLATQGGFVEQLLRPQHFLGLAILLACMFYTWFRGLPFNLLGALAAPAKLLVLTAPGEQYGVYDAFFSLVVSILVILVCSHALRERQAPSVIRHAAVSVILIGLVFVGYAIDQLGIPRETWSRSSIFGRIPYSNAPYMSSDEETTVRKFLSSLRSPRLIRVQFYPESEALLFHDMDGDRIRLIHPTFCERVDPETKLTVYQSPADVHIVHLSQYLPERLYWHMSLHIKVMSWVPVPESDLRRLPLLHRRDSTESWHYFIAATDVRRK